MTSNFPIETGVPVPPKSKYPLAQLRVGESIFVPGKKESRSAQMIAYAFAKRHPAYKFVSRAQKDPEGIRIWRVEASR